MHPLQEKFQILTPVSKKDEAADHWVSASSQRTQTAADQWKPEKADSVNTDKFNLLPPGMELANQWRTDQPQIPLVMSGDTDVSKDTNPESWAEGFTRRDMKGTDDQYTGEHVDLFYGDAGGFAERNNYLDRL